MPIINIMDEILKQNIIKDLGLDKLSQAEQEEVLLSIGKLIYQGVIVRVMNELSEKDKEEFDKLLMEKIDDQEAVFNFLKSKIPHLDELVNEEIGKFKKESLEFMKKVEE